MMQTSTTAKLESTRSLTPVRSPLLQRKCACGNSAGLTGTCSDCQTQNLTLQRRSIEPTEGAEVPPLMHELLPIQTKLTIGKPGDVYEQEADQIADRVMRMPEPSIQRQVEPEEEEEQMIQTKAIYADAQANANASQITPFIQRQGLPEIEEEEGVIQTKETAHQAPSSASTQVSSEAPPIVYEVLNSPGQPLDPETRFFMEPHFGHDFSQVRVHMDSKAAESASAVNALAYTVGRNVVFGAGQYAPGTTIGQRLLAHELTHVVQQGTQSTTLNANLDVNASNSPLEQAADSIERGVFGTQYASGAGPFQQGYGLLQRKVSSDIATIRKKLTPTLGLIRESTIKNVLSLLKTLSDPDLKDTLADLEKNESVDRIFEHVGKADRENEAMTLERIRQLRPGKRLLLFAPNFAVCEKPSQGEWQMASKFKDLPDLIQQAAVASTTFLLAKLAILAHGDSPGAIKIGKTDVNIGNIDNFKTEIGSLSQFLTTDAIVYLYGCISGSAQPGSAFLKEWSLLLPGRTIVGFNTLNQLLVEGHGERGKPCVWPEVVTTNIRGEILRANIKTLPADERSPTAKVAKNGKIITWPSDESAKYMDGTKQSESPKFNQFRKEQK